MKLNVRRFAWCLIAYLLGAAMTGVYGHAIPLMALVWCVATAFFMVSLFTEDEDR